jgi:hypothetical protein
MYRSVPARCLTGRWSCCSRHELVRREVVEARMRTHASIITFASARDRNHSRLRLSLPKSLSI